MNFGPPSGPPPGYPPPGYGPSPGAQPSNLVPSREATVPFQGISREAMALHRVEYPQHTMGPLYNHQGLPFQTRVFRLPHRTPLGAMKGYCSSSCCAWNASYSMGRIAATGSLFAASHAGEGPVCRFQGPGTVYIQTHNPQNLGHWIPAQVPAHHSG